MRRAARQGRNHSTDPRETRRQPVCRNGRDEGRHPGRAARVLGAGECGVWGRPRGHLHTGRCVRGLRPRGRGPAAARTGERWLGRLPVFRRGPLRLERMYYCRAPLSSGFRTHFLFPALDTFGSGAPRVSGRHTGIATTVPNDGGFQRLADGTRVRAVRESVYQEIRGARRIGLRSVPRRHAARWRDGCSEGKKRHGERSEPSRLPGTWSRVEPRFFAGAAVKNSPTAANGRGGVFPGVVAPHCGMTTRNDTDRRLALRQHVVRGFGVRHGEQCGPTHRAVRGPRAYVARGPRPSSPVRWNRGDPA